MRMRFAFSSSFPMSSVACGSWEVKYQMEMPPNTRRRMPNGIIVLFIQYVLTLKKENRYPRNERSTGILEQSGRREHQASRPQTRPALKPAKSSSAKAYTICSSTMYECGFGYGK